MTESKYSAQELYKFLDYASKKGLLKKNTATSRKIASMKILEILDDSDKTDLRNIDLDDVFNRFQNRSGSNFKPESLGVYKSRFKSALDDFMRWSENPSAFRPSVKSRTARSGEAQDGQQKNTKAATSSSRKRGSMSRPGVSTDLDVHGVVFPIPIRQGVVVKIANIPNDLTKEEASKIAAVVHALAASEKKG
mgnify:FL=1